MGTDPSGAGPEDEPRGSCLSNLFWLSHVFKTNPVWHSVYRTGTGDKSSFVTNTIPPSPNGKASTRDREREATWIHTRPVCFFSTFVVNIVVERGPPGRYSCHWRWCSTMIFPQWKYRNWFNRKKKLSGISTIYSIFKILFFQSLLLSFFKFPWKIYSGFDIKIPSASSGI